ncbi:MAG: hypothetical protein HY805_02845 [Nitrospirae bacterium]|nr:hypothetical protein [Nitrospirota bacterium]
MPNISIYLNDETLEAVRTKSKIQKIPLSTVIREAVEQSLDISESKDARRHVLKVITEKKPLGKWKELHKERTAADVHRS